MIAGTGTDLTEIARIQQALERYGERFLKRVYTDAEIRYCQRKRHTAAESLAARFAAKEAGRQADAALPRQGGGACRGHGCERNASQPFAWA